MVTIKVLNMRDLTLDGFNWQNVLGELIFYMEPGGLKVTLYPLHGLGGSFVCNSPEIVSAAPVA